MLGEIIDLTPSNKWGEWQIRAEISQVTLQLAHQLESLHSGAKAAGSES
jgi:hypothetical protein